MKEPTSRAYLEFQKNRETIKAICYGCGAKSLKADFSFINRLFWMSNTRIVFKLYAGGGGCVVVYKGKKNLRVLLLAVREQMQRRGIGKMIMRDIMNYARAKGLHCITLRANISERADVYYASQFGFIRDSVKGNDYEMHKELK